MNKVLRTKNLILLLLSLILLTSVTAFSVSYAKWAGGDTLSVNGTASIGSWSGDGSLSLPDYTNGLAYTDSNGKQVSVNLTEEGFLTWTGTNYVHFFVKTTRDNQTIKLKLMDQVITFNLFTDTYASKNEDDTYTIKTAGVYQIFVSYDLNGRIGISTVPYDPVADGKKVLVFG